MKILKYPTPKQLLVVLARPLQNDPETKQRVSLIIDDVRQNGDVALFKLNREIDGYSSNVLEIPRTALSEAKKDVSDDLKDSIRLAIDNIEKFHSVQRPTDTLVETMPRVRCGIRFKALERVGLYIPGGTAPLLSTVLMLAVPAKVAGCKELIICTPPNPTAELLYALSLFDARVFTVGGAQAIAAMAFGTETVPRVDKIFGPGNRYVTEAKVQVSAMGIPFDMPAGPSEVLVIADETANPSFVAADLLSQAEHGTDSQVMLVCNSQKIIDLTLQELNQQIETLPRKNIALKCLENSTAILVNSLDEAMCISNSYAPEHLILAVDRPNELAEKVVNAGSVFMGHYTPESVGDYTSGTNHTLPTSGFARSWSGVNLLSFMKTIIFQELTKEGLAGLAKATTTLARAEGLEAHARAVEQRINGSLLEVGNTATIGKVQSKVRSILRPNIQNLKPYSSARDEFEGEASIWLDANESPIPLPNLTEGINRYPDPLQRELKKSIATIKGTNENQIFIGNGSDEAIDLLFRCFCNPTADKVLVFPPTYGMYGVCAAVNDIEVIESMLDEVFNINLKDFEEKQRLKPKLTFICNPNNPTGNVQNAEVIRQVLDNSEGIVVVDEAYVDYCPEHSVLNWLNLYPNLVVLQTLSKAWGLAGARVGLAFASPEIISVMNKIKFPYNVGKPSIDIASKALNSKEIMRQRVDEIILNREMLVNALTRVSAAEIIYPSETNFLLVKFSNPKGIYNLLAQNGIVVRDRSNQPGCKGCLRITVGTKNEVKKFIDVLKQI
ncbi:MAG: histidinol dehydrogenase [Tenuifilaceae bacterium]|jgi:histidinol dehydrogenase|nr:histidinol dehydrogenase [Tenuifilaceae bacterium]